MPYTNPPSPAATATAVPPLPRTSIEEMSKAKVARGRVFGRISALCLETYRNLHIFLLLRCFGLARAYSPSSQQVTDAVQDRELLTIAVARRLYQVKEGKRNEVLETAALRFRISRPWGGGQALFYLWHEVVDAAEG